ncbi:kinase-like protein [Xylaria intraflava]|nr:kinase-like protein [Xylaria intraflava]
MTPVQGTGEGITACEEVQAVPQQWEIKLEGENNRVAFHLIGTEAKGPGTYEHPIFGKLPLPWELRKNAGKENYIYYNTLRGQEVERGPHRIPRDPNAPDSTGVRRESMRDVPIESSTHPLDSKYLRIHTLDPGGAGIGAMNCGVHVVRSKATAQVCVEKVLRGDDPHSRRTAKTEIKMMQKLRHEAIVRHLETYYQKQPFAANIYMELCKEGTLQDLIKGYGMKEKAHDPDYIPESFIWQVFVELADALAYLQTGQSYLSMTPQINDRRKWWPIAHGDIKPANIFLHARGTPGSTTIHAVLADFGLAREEEENRGARARYGTVYFHAPELAFDPCPRAAEMRMMASPHSGKSDVWAMTCCMFLMCKRSHTAHMDGRFKPGTREALGRVAKKTTLDISDVGVYSHYLARTIAWAASSDPSQRPDGWELILEAKAEHDLWKNDPAWKAQVDVNGALPPEATKELTF